MSNYVIRSHAIILEKRQDIARRYRVVTKAINVEYWNTNSETMHSIYVGSYGRGTAISTSDIDILVELPKTEFNKFDSSMGNGQSRLLQSIRHSIQKAYPRSDIRADGQVVKINFHDGIKFEILPAFKDISLFDNSQTYTYPNSNKGGKWETTNPKSEQDAMKIKNSQSYSNGLIFATCRHMRYIRDTFFSSYHLSGIVIDSFVNVAMGNWKYNEVGVSSSANYGDYENVLLEYFHKHTLWGLDLMKLNAPGSNQPIDTSRSIECLEKVLKKMAL